MQEMLVLAKGVAGVELFIAGFLREEGGGSGRTWAGVGVGEV